MKLNKLVVALGLGMALVSGAAFAAGEGTGTVTFNGEIIKAPCSLKAEDVNQVVPMGQINSAVLEAGNTSSPETFDLKLVDCTFTGDKSVSITFAGTEGATAGSLALTGTAKGANLGLKNQKDGTEVKINTKADLGKIVSGDNTLTFQAFLQADGASATIVPGAFSAVTNFTLAYQ